MYESSANDDAYSDSKCFSKCSAYGSTFSVANGFIDEAAYEDTECLTQCLANFAADESAECLTNELTDDVVADNKSHFTAYCSTDKSSLQ